MAGGCSLGYPIRAVRDRWVMSTGSPGWPLFPAVHVPKTMDRYQNVSYGNTLPNAKRVVTLVGCEPKGALDVDGGTREYGWPLILSSRLDFFIVGMSERKGGRKERRLEENFQNQRVLFSKVRQGRVHDNYCFVFFDSGSSSSSLAKTGSGCVSL